MALFNVNPSITGMMRVALAPKSIIREVGRPRVREEWGHKIRCMIEGCSGRKMKEHKTTRVNEE
jgi:hypothetical protein